MRMNMAVKMGLALVSMVLAATGAQAQFKVGDPAPDIKAVDINGKVVDLAAVLDQKPDLAVLFFFTVDKGQELAITLQVLNQTTKGLEIVALGMEEDKDALAAFAKSMGIDYYVIPASQVEDTSFREKIQILPVTLFVMTQEKKIDRVVVGGSSTQAKLLSIAAENFFRQRKLEEAKAVADLAIEKEDPKLGREIKGFALTAEGKLDEAEAEFGAIDSKAGLAKVALERGDYEKAATLADQDTTGYGTAVKGQALMHSGKLEEAAAALSTAFSKDIPDWQRSEAANLHGRVQQELGQTDGAITQYEQAIALDPYNVVALSNEGAAKRSKGDLEGAQAALERAQNIRQDDLAAMMLQQIQRELKRANDIEQAKLIDKQIQDLSARIKEMKASGAQQQADSWSTRPLVMAFLPSNYTPVFFERAGTDVVLQRELESVLQEGGEVGVVEREMLDKLLQELNLGSSELADPSTQRNLGRVLSAGVLGFLEFAQLGQDKMMYLRLIDSETSAILGILRQKIDEDNPAEVVRAVAEELVAKMANGDVLKGKIADASADDAIYINLGSRHGAVEGQEFIVLQDADPIKIGDKVIAHRTRPVGKIVVTNLETDYAICKVSQRTEGVTFAPEMKIQASK